MAKYRKFDNPKATKAQKRTAELTHAWSARMASDNNTGNGAHKFKNRESRSDRKAECRALKGRI